MGRLLGNGGKLGKKALLCLYNTTSTTARPKVLTYKSGVELSLLVQPTFQCVLAHLKTVAFIAGKSKNPGAQNFFIRFSIDNLIANISLYALSWPKLNFGCYLTFEIFFKALFQWKNK